MRYIKKDKEPPSDFQEWIKDNWDKIEAKYSEYNKDKDNTKSEITWKLLPSSPPQEEYSYSKADLRRFLLNEQGAICAYCGSRILDNTNVRLDHIFPKSSKIEGTFDYHNITAACSGGEYIWHTINKGETLESIAKKYETEVDAIIRLNEGVYFDEKVVIEVKIKVSVKMPHCDVKKGNNYHPIKPTDESCQSKFKYSTKGEIESVELCETQKPNCNVYLDDANKTICVLGLNDNQFILEKRRNILYSIDAFVKNIYKISPLQLKDKLLQKKSLLYQNTENLPEMVFVWEYFLNTYLSKK